MKKILVLIAGAALVVVVVVMVVTAFAAMRPSPFDEVEDHVHLMGLSFDEVAAVRSRMADKPTVMQQYREVPEGFLFKEISWHFKDGRLNHVGYTIYRDWVGRHVVELKKVFGPPAVEKTDSEISRVNYEWRIGERIVTTSSTDEWMWLD